MLFTSAVVGWVKTHGDHVWHTTDGGANWKEIAAFSNLTGSFSYHAAVGGTYFFHRLTRVYRTDDGGATVTQLGSSPLGSQRGGGMCFTDLKHGCIAFEPNGGYAITTDGGNTWKQGKVKNEDAWGVCATSRPVLSMPTPAGSCPNADFSWRRLTGEQPGNGRTPDARTVRC